MEGIQLRPNEVLLLGTGDVVRRSGRYDSVLILASPQHALRGKERS